MVLRKLTRKSQLNFGKFADFTIQDLLNIGNEEYLIWVYCSASHINFFEDILDELKIPLKYRLKKPAVNKDKKFISKLIHLNRQEQAKDNAIKKETNIGLEYHKIRQHKNKIT